MTMIILNTDVISEILRKNHADRRVIDWFIHVPMNEVYTTSVTTAELLTGIALLPEGARKRRLGDSVQRFISLYLPRTLPFDAAAAPYYAAVHAQRRAAGRPVTTQDVMIAAIALACDATLVTRNVKDFEHTGVKLFNPWER
ncbi:type II toxin-antitoxin system VapC family toxin [Bifidobacterium pullorum]|uniref:type II toxin-antitoxin system VapC family toxin n=1 Tax=Bifidobacterium pullorum TaxID=78448 RepID=UPI000A98FB14|nr:type II toxin-antitoxin system VapC family toxin [Bifidobacterium pullorum]